MRRSSTEASVPCKARLTTSPSPPPRRCKPSPPRPAAVYRFSPRISSPYGINRYVNETKRLYSVLEERLKGREFILDNYGIVDIKTFGWVRGAPRLGIELDEFPNLKAWVDRIANRPAVQAGIANSQ